jgi:hypothetical protein
MPFIITTTTPEMADHVAPGQPWPRRVTRCAVAAFDDRVDDQDEVVEVGVRGKVRDIMLGLSIDAEPPWPEGSNAANWAAVDALARPSSPGASVKIGPLPDGTTIAAEEMVNEFGCPDVRGFLRGWHFPAGMDEAEILAAFNAEQDAER